MLPPNLSSWCVLSDIIYFAIVDTCKSQRHKGADLLSEDSCLIEFVLMEWNISAGMVQQLNTHCESKNHHLVYTCIMRWFLYIIVLMSVIFVLLDLHIIFAVRKSFCSLLNYYYLWRDYLRKLKRNFCFFCAKIRNRYGRLENVQHV